MITSSSPIIVTKIAPRRQNRPHPPFVSPSLLRRVPRLFSLELLFVALPTLLVTLKNLLIFSFRFISYLLISVFALILVVLGWWAKDLALNFSQFGIFH